jgi:hypothetical protein
MLVRVIRILKVYAKVIWYRPAYIFQRKFSNLDGVRDYVMIRLGKDWLLDYTQGRQFQTNNSEIAMELDRYTEEERIAGNRNPKLTSGGQLLSTFYR